MNNDDWNTGWDPHQALLQCEQNIMQCAAAINHGTEIMKELAAKYNHQQEVIQQLQFNNRKLQQMVESFRSDLIRQETRLHLLETKSNQ
jgi:Mg2+ and Co2+ transporter CorA